MPLPQIRGPAEVQVKAAMSTYQQDNGRRFGDFVYDLTAPTGNP